MVKSLKVLLHGYIFEVGEILQLWWQGGKRQTLGMWELLQSWSCSAVAPSFLKAFCQKHRFGLWYLCLRIISSPYLLLKRAALFSSYSEESIAKKRSLYADNSRSKGCLTCQKQKILQFWQQSFKRMSHRDKWGEALCHSPKVRRRPGNLWI